MVGASFRCASESCQSLSEFLRYRGARRYQQGLRLLRSTSEPERHQLVRQVARGADQFGKRRYANNGGEPLVVWGLGGPGESMFLRPGVDEKDLIPEPEVLSSAAASSSVSTSEPPTWTWRMSSSACRTAAGRRINPVILPPSAKWSRSVSACFASSCNAGAPSLTVTSRPTVSRLPSMRPRASSNSVSAPLWPWRR